ncbi:hypothetical protein ACFVGY_30535 [Streptomyces sp. NPDC127106]|uniref:hypothetical protein n=1 Tax=Streptomyces sp. NPDC127106 TaxID=3345360 RepID=UPI003641C7F0
MLERVPRLRNAAIPVVFAFTTVMVLAGQAHAADYAPVGIGDLFSSPSSDDYIPKGGETMYELYDAGRWTIDADISFWEGVDGTAHLLANILMGLLVIVGLAMTVIVGWVFRFTSIPEMENAISGMIGGASQSLMEFILPSALAVGALIAFVQHRKGGGGGGLSQIAWVLISAVVSVSLLTSPQTWVSGVDSARQIGASVTMTATADGLGDGSSDYPFKLKNQPKFTNNGRDTLLRKSQDSIWRGFVATPWCLAEFGSMEVCKEYGRRVLDQGTSGDKREDFINDNLKGGTVGDASVEWVKGDSPVGRIMVLVPALVVALLFAILLLVLSFTSLAAFLGTLLLLLTGVFFACLWVIPGRPRQWGLAWFDQLLARTLESFLATMVLGAVLSAQTATMQMFGKYGWLPTMGLSIALGVVAFQFRSVLAQILGIRGASNGGMVAGVLASRFLSRGGGKGRPAPGHHYQPVRTLGGRGGGGGGGGRPELPPGPNASADTTVTITRVPQQRPPVPLPPSSGTAPSGSSKSLPASTTTPSSTAPSTSSPGTSATATTIPAPRPGLPPQSRPTLPPSTSGSAQPPVSAGTTGPGPHSSKPTPVMRPEAGGAPNYAFRQAPAPQAPGEPKIIQGTVIRSTTVGAPPRQPATAPARQPVSPPRSDPQYARPGNTPDFSHLPPNVRT